MRLQISKRLTDVEDFMHLQMMSNKVGKVDDMSFCIFRSVLSTVNGFATTILIYTTAISELLESDFNLHINL